VLATGASARPAPWADLPVLRTLDDAQYLSTKFGPGSRLLVIGAGFIGSELASTAHALGLHVTVVDPLDAPIARIVGSELGARLARWHGENGVESVLGTGVTAVEPSGGGWAVHLADGSVHVADVVVAGIGARPNDDWIAASGLPVADGVLCDEYSRVAGYSDIYAVGDVARWLHPRHGEEQRIEHWTNAVEQSESVARSVCAADPVPYAPIEYVWTDQYAHKVQIIGRPAAGQPVFATPGGGPRTGVLFVGSDDALVGAVTIDWPRGMLAARRVLADAGSLAAAQDAWEPLVNSAPVS
jgi:phthalate 3,4-dioxygenase ferredoxin reductase subunit